MKDKTDFPELKEEDFSEANIYSELGREELVEEDELSITETGFMEGYEES